MSRTWLNALLEDDYDRAALIDTLAAVRRWLAQQGVSIDGDGIEYTVTWQNETSGEWDLPDAMGLAVSFAETTIADRAVREYRERSTRE